MDKTSNTQAERRVEKSECSSTPAKSKPLKCYFLAVRWVLNRLKSALKRRNIIILATITGFLFGFLPLFHSVKKAMADLAMAESNQDMAELTNILPILQENSLLSFSSPTNPDPVVARELQVVITGYSSSPWETDDTPFITASGKWVKKGIVANNLLSFGTKIRIPELYGEQIFIVEDRMHYNKSNYHIDIWFPSYWEALNFGAKITYIEILGS